MILEHKGKKVDFFQKLFTEDIVVRNFTKFYTVRKLGAWVSGGADSAFCLWYMAKCITENELWDFELIPIHGHDTARVADSRIAANAVVDYVKKSFPKVNIHDNYIFQYHKDKNNKDIKKGKWHKPIEQELKKNETVHITINSFTSNPPKQDMMDGGFYDNRQKNRDDPRAVFDEQVRQNIHKIKHGTGVETFFDTHRPFAEVDKKFLAHFYKEYNIMDLFKLTVSCTSGYEGEIVPCKKCFWCKEKFWAFKMYDGGVKHHYVWP